MQLAGGKKTLQRPSTRAKRLTEPPYPVVRSLLSRPLRFPAVTRRVILFLLNGS
jgi:hypothetical protein